MSEGDVTDSELNTYVNANKDAIAAQLLQVDYGRNLYAVLYLGATTFPEEQAYIDSLRSKQKVNEYNGYLADAIHIYSLATQGDAVYLGALSELVGHLSTVLTGIEVYKKFSGVLKLADERQILFEYFQKRFDASTGEIRSDEQQVWDDLVNTYEPVLLKIAALRGIKKDPINNLHEWYKNAFYSYLLVGYGDYSVNLRSVQGKVIAQLAKPVVSSFNINNDDATTQSLTVTLNATVLGAPYEYQTSEDLLFAGAAWLKLRANLDPLFTLSPGEGYKKIYFRVRNREGIASSSVADRILFTLTPPTPTPTPDPTPEPTPTSTPTPTPGACVSTSVGLVGWWKGEANANDSVGGNNGTLLNGTTFAPGMVGRGFQFDGVDDYVDVPDSGSLDSITTAATVEGWIKPGMPSTLREYIFARRDPNMSEGISVAVYNDGKFAVIIRTASSPMVSGSTFVTAPGAITFDQWQHVAATVDTVSGSVNVYINGQPYPVSSIEGPDSFSGDLVNVNHLFIGRREGNEFQGLTGAAYFKGEIDELSLFNRALSATEVGAIHMSGSAGKCMPLASTLFFDGSSDARLTGFYFGEPVVDSHGRIIVTGGYSTLIRIFSISPQGVLSWQAPNGTDSLPYDSFSSYVLRLGPDDRVYAHTTQNRIFAFDSSGSAVPGWPVENIIPPDTTEGNWAMAGPAIIDGRDGTVYAKSGVFYSFTGFPSTVVAYNPDGSLKWRKNYSSGSKNFHLVQGPARDIYTLIDNQFVALSHDTGVQVCSNTVNVFFGSLVGGLEGVATSFRDGISGQDGSCNSQLLLPATDREVVLQRYDRGTILAIDYPVAPFDPSQTKLLAVSQGGMFLWRNPDVYVSPYGPPPIRAVRAGVMYVLGQDLAEGNKPKLFLISVATGQVLNSIETTSLCSTCGVAVANDGTIYLNDLGSTKIYKIN